MVRLPYARIVGQLNCSGGLFDNSKGYALIANNAEIRGGVFLCKITDGAARFHAKGEVNLQQARIVGQLSCHGGEFDNSRGTALTADGADIHGDAQLTNGFHATGEVRLLGARISDQLNCSDGTFENSKGTALNLQEARANSLWLRNLRPRTAGVIDLVETDVSLFADDPTTIDSRDISFRLDGFTYERIAPNSPRDVETRLRWLERAASGLSPSAFRSACGRVSAQRSGLRGQGRTDRQAPQASKNASSWVAIWVAT